MGHLATPFLVFFSFLDSTISGHVTQISDFLRYRKIKVTDFSEVAEFWKVLINFHKVMIILDFMQISLNPCLNMLETNSLNINLNIGLKLSYCDELIALFVIQAIYQGRHVLSQLREFAAILWPGGSKTVFFFLTFNIELQKGSKNQTIEER